MGILELTLARPWGMIGLNSELELVTGLAGAKISTFGVVLFGLCCLLDYTLHIGAALTVGQLGLMAVLIVCICIEHFPRVLTGNSMIKNRVTVLGLAGVELVTANAWGLFLVDLTLVVNGVITRSLLAVLTNCMQIRLLACLLADLTVTRLGVGLS